MPDAQFPCVFLNAKEDHLGNLVGRCCGFVVLPVTSVTYYLKSAYHLSHREESKNFSTNNTH